MKWQTLKWHRVRVFTCQCINLVGGVCIFRNTDKECKHFLSKTCNVQWHADTFFNSIELHEVEREQTHEKLPNKQVQVKQNSVAVKMRALLKYRTIQMAFAFE